MTTGMFLGKALEKQKHVNCVSGYQCASMYYLTSTKLRLQDWNYKLSNLT